MNALTITSCKRSEHFKKTLISFDRYCKDKDLIDLIIWYDDNSTSEDRVEMLKILLSIFENKKIITNFFSENSFNTKKRHKEIMNLWKTDITNLSLDYVFHTEEDFEYVSEFSISEAIEFLKNKEDVAMVGFSQEKREIPKEVSVDLSKIKQYIRNDSGIVTLGELDLYLDSNFNVDTDITHFGDEFYFRGFAFLYVY